MTRLTVTVFLLFTISLRCFAQEFIENWTSLPVVKGTRYDDVCFLDSMSGWAASGNLGVIYKTNNSGASWSQSFTSGKYLRSIEFLDANTGFCGAVNGGFYRTVDGGAHWDDIGPLITPQPPGICGLAKGDANTIYGVGVWFSPAYVVKSTDKGVTWTHIDMSMYATSLIDAYFFDADHGFVTGSVNDEEGGVVLYTADGGVTWEEKYRTNHEGDRIWKIQSPDGEHFFGSIESWSGETRMIRSKDKGQTWETLLVHPDYYYCQTVGFIDPLTGWTGGRETLFETRDGGETWKKVPVGTAYNRFERVNNTTAFLTGSKIYKFTKTPAPDPVLGIGESETYDPIHYLSISPNPNNGKARLEVDFGTRTMAILYLCDVSGRKVKSIFEGVVDAGKRSWDIEVTDQPDNTYLVIVKTHEGLESAKFVKISNQHGR